MAIFCLCGWPSDWPFVWVVGVRLSGGRLIALFHCVLCVAEVGTTVMATAITMAAMVGTTAMAIEGAMVVGEGGV